jgi:hypothetical protein
MSLTRDEVSAAVEYNLETGVLRWKFREGVRACVNAALVGKEVRAKAHDNGWGNKYYRVTVCGKRTYLHRVIWTLLHGDIPIGLEVDHIDGDGTNNHPDNLRLVSHADNLRNMRRRKSGESGRVGVRYDSSRKKWIAFGTAPGMRKVNLGRFASREQAIAARVQFEQAHAYHPNHGQLRSA